MLCLDGINKKEIVLQYIQHARRGDCKALALIQSAEEAVLMPRGTFLLSYHNLNICDNVPESLEYSHFKLAG
jgi:hypothetical protein